MHWLKAVFLYLLFQVLYFPAHLVSNAIILAFMTLRKIWTKSAVENAWLLIFLHSSLHFLNMVNSFFHFNMWQFVNLFHTFAIVEKVYHMP